MTALALSFQETQFDVVNHNNQPWLKGSEVATALGYSRPDALNKIYERNKDEFTDGMVRHVKLTLRNENNELQHNTVRVFSLRGCHLLAMFARTKVAKEFRKWVLDVLDKETQLSENPEAPISINQQGVIFNLMADRFPDGRERPYGWSRFQNHFNINSYKNLPASKFNDACKYIQSMPEKPARSLPVKRYNYPRKLLEQPSFMSGKNPVGLSPAMLSDTEAFVSPLFSLLNELRADGHDVSAPWDEAKAMREGLKQISDTLNVICMKALNSLSKPASTALK